MPLKTSKYCLIIAIIFCLQASGQNFITSSLPFQYKSLNQCLELHTGIKTMKATSNKGDFSLDCLVHESFNTLGAILYPIPVKNMATIKLSIAPPANSIFQISAWTPLGQKMEIQEAFGSALFQGVQINLSVLSAGSYYLVLHSAHHMDAIKFVKID